MSLFNKIKDVLFDIEEEEEIIPVKKEKKIVEENPIKEVKMPKEDIFEEEVVPKKVNNFNFPMDFEDEIPVRREPKNYDYSNERKKDYFNDDYDIPRRTKSDYGVRETVKPKEEVRDYSKYLQPKKEEKKLFTPSPVISPVYGILNQNYTKDDVIVKADNDVNMPSLDEVRRKAYKKQEEVKEIDEFEEPLKTLDEILINGKIETEEIVEEVVTEKEEVFEDEITDKEDLLEKDLFNLIDSMYEDKEEEED